MGALTADLDSCVGKLREHRSSLEAEMDDDKAHTATAHMDLF